MNTWLNCEGGGGGGAGVAAFSQAAIAASHPMATSVRRRVMGWSTPRAYRGSPDLRLSFIPVATPQQFRGSLPPAQPRATSTPLVIRHPAVIYPRRRSLSPRDPAA